MMTTYVVMVQLVGVKNDSWVRSPIFDNIMAIIPSIKSSAAHSITLLYRRLTAAGAGLRAMKAEFLH